VMKQFILGFVAALVLIVVGGYAYLALGLAPVATAAPPLPFEKRITSIALNARIDKEAPKSSPIPASEEAYAAGFRHMDAYSPFPIEEVSEAIGFHRSKLPVIVLAVMRLVWEMTTVPKFPTHHAFAAPAHAVSFSSATTTSARPCIGANGKRSDNGGDP